MTTAEKLTTIAENEQKVYDAGVQSGEIAIWNGITAHGARTDYNYAFCRWHLLDDNGDILFKPIYDIKPTLANLMFTYTYRINGTSGTIDLVELFDKYGTTFDLSNCTTASMLFYACAVISRVGVIDLSNASSASTAINRMFENSSIVTIDELIFNETTAYKYTNMFKKATALENLTIGGKITQNGFDVSDCTLLTHDSLMSIVNALSDKTTDTSGTSWVLTLGTTNLEKLSDEEKAVATEKGWTLA